MTARFEREFVVGWADLDANGHMRNSAFLDHCVDLRFIWFVAQGFPASEFARLRVGPVVQRDEIEYFRELGLLDRFTIDICLAGLSDDGSRSRIRNSLAKPDGTAVARVTSVAGWLDLDARRLVAPPAELLECLRQMPHSVDFEELRSSVRPRTQIE